MVNLDKRVWEIKQLIDAGKYFTINRARQYGKTTTILYLANYLKNIYDVLNLDFQKISSASFKSEDKFVQAFCRLVLDREKKLRIPETVKVKLQDYVCRKKNKALFDELFSTMSAWCSLAEKPIVMIIDEVDAAADNQVFLDFLSQLRAEYLEREGDPDEKTFQSVILAGVTDVKHMKSRIRLKNNSQIENQEGSKDRSKDRSKNGNLEDSRENSPWNIATDFTVDMSLSEDGIKGMLDDYEADHHTGMNTQAVSKSIREYTNGYPFLVSRICQLVDEKVCKSSNYTEAWTREGIDEAVKLILAENNTLFQSLTKNLNNYPELKAAIRSILMEGTKLTWNSQQDAIVKMQMYGLVRNDNNIVRVANRIFETLLYNLFISDEELKNNVFSKEGELAKNQFVTNGKLNVRLIIEYFIKTYTQIYGPLRERFREKDGRELFLLYLKPIINGTGNYYIEAQTRDQTRTDVIVDYLGQQYIIELKIWYGERYNNDGERQVTAYLDYWNLKTGYMLSFNFNQKKETGVKRVQIGDKVLFEGML